MTPRRCLALAVAAALPAACAPAPEPAAAGAPARLAETGLYADFAARTIDPANLPFAPQYPLWSDGATKRRWVRLPTGRTIDASDPDAWVFPTGTRFWKEFSLAGQPIETRYLERRADGSWLMATYAWTPDGDAVLAPERGIRAAARTAAGAPFDIPSRNDCRACHDSGCNVVLGFGALQLSSDRDPLAPHAEAPPPGAVDLDVLVARGLLVGLPAALVAQAPRIAARTPRERAALGYLHGNCAGCHNSHGPLASLGMSLTQPVAAEAEPAALRTTLGCASRFCTSGADTRIVAGDPHASVLFRRLAARDPLTQMPPLGSQVLDDDAIELIAAWIREDLLPVGAASAEPLTTFPRRSAMESQR
jgi:mono/diheme cytochrome c family protein